VTRGDWDWGIRLGLGFGGAWGRPGLRGYVAQRRPAGSARRAAPLVAGLAC
jgi:hypothetical protein